LWNGRRSQRRRRSFDSQECPYWDWRFCAKNAIFQWFFGSFWLNFEEKQAIFMQNRLRFVVI
jgi:hypothetical protein